MRNHKRGCQVVLKQHIARVKLDVLFFIGYSPLPNVNIIAIITAKAAIVHLLFSFPVRVYN